MSKLKEAEDFLNKLRRIKRHNRNFGNDWRDVYSQLMDYDIPSLYSQIPGTPKDYFETWIKYFSSSDNINVFHDEDWPCFCQFINGFFYGKYIKVYISLDKEHICEGVKRIFSFLEKENIQHISKVANEFRSDSIVIRLKYDDLESLKKLSNFIENDSYIQEGILKTNPFTPTIGSMAVIKDNGDSYNEKLSRVITDFLNKINLKKPIEINDFLKYASKTFLENSFDIWNEVLMNAYNPNYGFKNLCDDKTLEFENVDIISRYEEAILATYEKYGANQALAAIMHSMEDDFELITRSGKDGKTDYRGIIMDNLTGEKIQNYIRKTINIEGNIDNNNIVDFFCMILYKYKGQIFDSALKATVAKFQNDQESVKVRIRKYRDLGKAEEFTSYGLDPEKKFNYRKSVVDNIDPKEVNIVIKAILNVKGINWRNLSDEELLNEYSSLVLKELGLSSGRK